MVSPPWEPTPVYDCCVSNKSPCFEVIRGYPVDGGVQAPVPFIIHDSAGFSKPFGAYFGGGNDSFHENAVPLPRSPGEAVCDECDSVGAAASPARRWGDDAALVFNLRISPASRLPRSSPRTSVSYPRGSRSERRARTARDHGDGAGHSGRPCRRNRRSEAGSRQRRA